MPGYGGINGGDGRSVSAVHSKQLIDRESLHVLVPGARAGQPNRTDITARDVLAAFDVLSAYIYQDPKRSTVLLNIGLVALPSVLATLPGREYANTFAERMADKFFHSCPGSHGSRLLGVYAQVAYIVANAAINIRSITMVARQLVTDFNRYILGRDADVLAMWNQLNTRYKATELLEKIICAGLAGFGTYAIDILNHPESGEESNMDTVYRLTSDVMAFFQMWRGLQATLFRSDLRAVLRGQQGINDRALLTGFKVNIMARIAQLNISHVDQRLVAPHLVGFAEGHDNAWSPHLRTFCLGLGAHFAYNYASETYGNAVRDHLPDGSVLQTVAGPIVVWSTVMLMASGNANAGNQILQAFISKFLGTPSINVPSLGKLLMTLAALISFVGLLSTTAACERYANESGHPVDSASDLHEILLTTSLAAVLFNVTDFSNTMGGALQSARVMVYDALGWGRRAAAVRYGGDFSAFAMKLGQAMASDEVAMSLVAKRPGALGDLDEQRRVAESRVADDAEEAERAPLQPALNVAEAASTVEVKSEYPKTSVIGLGVNLFCRSHESGVEMAVVKPEVLNALHVLTAAKGAGVDLGLFYEQRVLGRYDQAAEALRTDFNDVMVDEDSSRISVI